MNDQLKMSHLTTCAGMGLNGTPERLEIAGMLKGYGNAIVAPVAEEFIRAYMTCRPE